MEMLDHREAVLGIRTNDNMRFRHNMRQALLIEHFDQLGLLYWRYVLAIFYMEAGHKDIHAALDLAPIC